jgi:hypothetical protein
MFRMQTWRNITLVLPGHNRKTARAARCVGVGLAGAAALLLAVLSGCVASHLDATKAIRLEVKTAEPTSLLPLARVRVSAGQLLPPHLVHPLCSEYALVVVRAPRDWTDFCRRLGLPPGLAKLDLDAGPVVGLLANVGESSSNKWPIRLVAVRVTEGKGSLRASFVPGLYHPVQTSGYLELAQLRGIRSIHQVQIDTRTFILGAPHDTDTPGRSDVP